MLFTLLATPASGQGGRLQGLKGGELSDADFERGVTVVVLWASWSPRCRDIVERVNAIRGKWGNKARVIMVSYQEERAAVESFLAGKAPSAEVFLDSDGAFSRAKAVTVLPGLLVIRDGKTDYRGRLPDAPDTLLAELLG